MKIFDVVGPWVVKLINLSFESGLVPSYFKHAVVNPTLKKTHLDPSEPKSYRPISKLPFVKNSGKSSGRPVDVLYGRAQIV